MPRWAHNPEVAGSNPAPATRSEARGTAEGRIGQLSGIGERRQSHLRVHAAKSLETSHNPRYRCRSYLPSERQRSVRTSATCRCEKPAQGAAAPKTRTPGSAAVVEGYLVAVGVRERESAAERPVDGR